MTDAHYRSLCKKISIVQGEIVKLSLLIKELQQTLEELSRRNNNELFLNFEKDDDDELSLPFQHYEEFKEFDEKLFKDGNFRQKIVCSNK